eukprot:Skav230535  [mRNA]  locus=scaffold1183:252110:252487:- [translate_table: standard]
MKSSPTVVLSMAVTLSAIFMGALQGCGDEDDTISSTAGGVSECTATVVDSCITAMNQTAAMDGDCTEITTFLTCMSACCEWSFVDNPTNATTVDGFMNQAMNGTEAVTYWAAESTKNSCNSTVSC